MSCDRFQQAMNRFDSDGLSPLCLAMKSGHVECAKILLESGCSRGPFPAGPLCKIFLSVPVDTEGFVVIRSYFVVILNFYAFHLNKILYQKVKIKLCWNQTEEV